MAQAATRTHPTGVLQVEAVRPLEAGELMVVRDPHP